jgi:hypothetical protein
MIISASRDRHPAFIRSGLWIAYHGALYGKNPYNPIK